MDLAVTIYDLSRGFPQNESYGITSQLRRSSVSIPSNIAEGQGRTSTREFAQFLSIARGSNCEVQTQLEIARRLKFGDSVLIDKAESLSHEVGKMLYTMLGRLRAMAG
jgi:four helix bundle protein